MTLLAFSNQGNWDSENIGFVGTISTEIVIQQGYINAIQNYIRDADVLSNEIEDEHKLLIVRIINNTESEFYDVMNEQGLTLWADCNKEPRFFVEFLNPEYGIFVFFTAP